MLLCTLTNSYRFEVLPELLQEGFISSVATAVFSFFSGLTRNAPNRPDNACVERLVGLGAPRKATSRNQTRTDILARAVMRHPSPQAKGCLELLHKKLRDKLGTLTNAQLTYLLEATKEARGGFKHSEELRKFLERDPKQMLSSRLITGLETLTAALAHFAIGRNIENEDRFLLEDRKAVRSLCQDSQAEQVPMVSDTYPCRYDSMITGPSSDSGRTITGPQREEISDSSGDDQEGEVRVKTQRRQLSARHFRCVVEEKETWVAQAQKEGVAFRCSVSGTTPLALKVMDWLLGDSLDGCNKEEALTLLTGVLIIPTYIRGDFHSVAEVATGYQHFISWKKKKRKR